ncbi:DUF2341 domain-containing protein [Methanosarcina acetivorans]|nr:DUF2341 domain-containing protein [Methanosarcina acetivorans]
MQDDGADLRFCTPYGEEIKYAIESVESTYFSVWVKLPIGIGEFLFYYGNQEAESESSPDDVFDEFFDKNSTSGWDTSNIAVTTYGEYLRFYNPTSSLVGGAQRYDLDLPSKYIMEIRANQVSILSLTFL